jgi:four helix bundle protein
VRNHTKLKVFQLADSLALLVYDRTTRFPREERFGLRSQLRRAAVSVAANIVEGAARPSDADFARMLAIAYGSTRELEYELSLAARLHYLKPMMRSSFSTPLRKPEEPSDR